MKKYFIILTAFSFIILPIYSSFLKVVGNKLYDENGNEVRLTGVNWFGFETGNLCPHGLWSRDYKSMLMQIKDLGFNCIRIPWCNAMLTATAPTGLQINAYGNDAYAAKKGIKLYPQAPEGFTGINLDLEGLSPLQILDKIIEEAGKLGLKIILDNHSRKPDSYMNETLWYTQDFSEEQWISDWIFLAQRYRGNPTVVGADLNNEPHGNTGMGMKPPASWGYDVPGYGNTDWAKAAEKCGNAILQVNPDWLIIVEGVEQYQNYYYWWGGNLMGVATRPINLIKPEKLVYSPHEYGPEVYNQSWFSDPNFPNNMPSIWYQYFGFIYDQNKGHILVGEFGIKDKSNTTAYTWFTEFMKYMGNKYSWTFWCFNPNSGDTGGILQDDWVTVNEWKMEVLRPYLAPLIGSSTSQTTIDYPPVINISTPSNNSTISGQHLIVVQASDDKGVSKIELYLNNEKLTETTSDMLVYAFDTTYYSNGIYTIKAIAYDTKFQSTYKEITITINNLPQNNQFISYINILSPINNQTISGTFNIQIEASTDIYKVNLYLDTSSLATLQIRPYTYSFDSSQYQNGIYTIKAEGISDSTTVIKEITITINNIVGDEPPQIVSANIPDGILSGVVNLQLQCNDDNLIDKIEIYIGSYLLKEISVNSASYNQSTTIDTTLFSNGSYTLTIVVYDNQQQSSSTNYTITILNNENFNNNNSTSNPASLKKIYILSLNSDGKNDKIVFPQTNIKIFDSKGNLIKELNNTQEWDGKDNSNRFVPLGVYIYTTAQNEKGSIIVLK